MIDVNGNEINSPSEEKKDPVFHLNEIRFLMRAFQREATDARALIIAKEISSYLKEDNDRTVIPEILPELEAYGKIRRVKTSYGNWFILDVNFLKQKA